MNDFTRSHFNKSYYICDYEGKLVYSTEPFGEYVEISQKEFYANVNEKNSKRYKRHDKYFKN